MRKSILSFILSRVSKAQARRALVIKKYYHGKEWECPGTGVP